MNARYKNIFVVGPIEYHDISAYRRFFVDSPKVVMSHFLRIRHLEIFNAESIRIHSGQYFPGRTVLAAAVHPFIRRDIY